MKFPLRILILFIFFTKKLRKKYVSLQIVERKNENFHNSVNNIFIVIIAI